MSHRACHLMFWLPLFSSFCADCLLTMTSRTRSVQRLQLSQNENPMKRSSSAVKKSSAILGDEELKCWHQPTDTRLTCCLSSGLLPETEGLSTKLNARPSFGFSCLVMATTPCRGANLVYFVYTVFYRKFVAEVTCACSQRDFQYSASTEITINSMAAAFQRR